MLDMRGNTAAYLMYSHARAFSLLAKVAAAPAFTPAVEAARARAVTRGVTLEALVDADFADAALVSSSGRGDIDACVTALVGAILAQYAQPAAPMTSVADVAALLCEPVPIRVRPIITHSSPSTPSGLRVDPSAAADAARRQSVAAAAYPPSFPVIALSNPSEHALALQVAKFQDAVVATVGALTPHVLCEYAHNLCTAFSNFYRDSPVLKTAGPGPVQEGESKVTVASLSGVASLSAQYSRIVLAHATRLTLTRSLHLLGVSPVKTM